MELRKEVFIERKNWSLVVHQQFEFEQYDTIQHPLYVLAHEGDVVVAGCRLIRCDKTLGNPDTGFGYTYMINDAYLGRLPLPSKICNEKPPVTSDYWELTRLCAKRGNRAASLSVMAATHEFLASQGAKGCLCLASPAIRRVANMAGYRTRDLGPIVRTEDEEGFLAFEIPIKTAVRTTKTRTQS
jgi:acyl homoserine lactone synthase